MSPRDRSIPFEQRIGCTVREAEGYSGLGNTKIWELIRDGRVKSTKVDGTRIIFVKSLLSVLGLEPSSPPSDAPPEAHPLPADFVGERRR